MAEWEKAKNDDGWEVAVGAKPVITTTPSSKVDKEAEYARMMEEIRRAQSAEKLATPWPSGYKWLAQASPMMQGAASLIAPSSVESIRRGIVPSVADLAVDVGLAATALAPPLRGATAAGTVGKNVALQGGLAAGAEGVSSTTHDRPYSLSAPIAGVIGGGVGGGIAANQMRNLRNLKVPEPAMGPVMSSLRGDRPSTIASLKSKTPEVLGNKYHTDNRIVTPAQVDALKKIGEMELKKQRVVQKLSKPEAELARKNLDDFVDGVLDTWVLNNDILRKDGVQTTAGPLFSDVLDEANRIKNPGTRNRLLDLLADIAPSDEKGLRKAIGKQQAVAILEANPPTVDKYLRILDAPESGLTVRKLSSPIAQRTGQLIAPSERKDTPPDVIGMQMLVKGGSAPVQAVPVTKYWGDVDEMWADAKKNKNK